MLSIARLRFILGIFFTSFLIKAFPQVVPDQQNLLPFHVSVLTHDLNRELYNPVKKFSFITHVPGNLARVAESPFQKKNLKPIAIIGGITTGLFLLDESITKGVGNTFRKWGIEQKEIFHTLIGIGDFKIIKYPGNINSFFYQLGTPTPTFLVAGGFYLYGKITRNPRSMRTASEITESFFTSLITVQILKRITGRQSPNRATVPGGKWYWFPSLSDYNKDVTNYIAYPSGHMAAMMSIVTVIAENYPEKKWIKPVFYTVTGLTALSQLNNKTHWASDYVLGLGIGYLSAKITHLRNQKKRKKGRNVIDQ